MHTSRLSAALGAAILTLTLGACGDDSSGGTADAAGSGTASSSAAATPAEASSLSMTDPWVKSAKTGMTAAFGTLVNKGTSDITVVSATSEITSGMELHETVKNDDGAMAMQPKEGGFTIPAGGQHKLTPGGDHLMIMDLNRALKPGEKVIISLTMSDESKTKIDATVKNFTGADEKYQKGDMGDMGDM